MINRTALAAVLLTSSAFAGPPLTTIQDVLYKADGTRFNGTLAIAWSSFQASDASAIATQTTAVRIVDGNLRVQLVPTAGSTPPMVYIVTYNSDGRVQFQETWSVPASTHSLRLSDVRVLTSNVSSPDTTGGGTTTVQESDVVGLSADLSARPVKGPGYASGRVAVVNSAGGLESVSGNASDCVRVDGSSGPCGGSSTGQPAAFVDAEAPGGIVDGSNTQFTLSAMPNPVSSVALYRNGVLQKSGQDYSIAGQTVTFLPVSTPQAGDTVLAWYRLSGGSDTTLSFADSDSLSGAIDGANAQFTLSATPNPVTSLAVFRNGLLQKVGSDYTVNGATIAFVAGATPQTGDMLTASYRLAGNGNGSTSFVDSDSPSGTLDGTNQQFTLSAVPNPSASLAVYRNGQLQKAGQDYTVANQTLAFVSGATPQPGDTLLASYRLSGISGLSSLPSSAYPSPQVLCSGTGSSTGAAVLASVGSCYIPAGVLLPGDRVEVRFDLEHQGAVSGFSFEVHWGATPIGHRDAQAADRFVTGRTDAGVSASGAVLSYQSWGAVLPFATGIVNALDPYSSGITIDFQGMLATAGPDTLTLRDYTVVRIP